MTRLYSFVLYLYFMSHFPEQMKILLQRQDTLYERQSQLKALLEASEGSEYPAKDTASTTVENWSGSCEWDSEADDVRFNVFGISTYRANQREVSTPLWHFNVLKVLLLLKL